MATVIKLPSGRYQVRYRDPRGESRKKSFRIKADAVNFQNRVEVTKVDGEYVAEKSKRLPFRDFYAQWWAGTGNRKSTRARDECHVRVHVLPHFGDQPIGTITYFDVRDWVAGLVASGLAPATVHKIFQCFAKPMRSAVKARQIPNSPCDDIDNLPSIRKKRVNIVAPSVINDVSRQMDPCYEAMPLVMGYCGLRLCELFALRRGRVDLLRRELHIVEDVVEVAGHGVVFDTVKTDAGVRTVPMPRLVADALERHMATYTDADADALVFTAPKGGVIRQHNWRRRHWKRATKRAGVPTLNPHHLRHTAVSLWIAMGANDKQIATWAGHASVYVVKDLYGHLFPGGADPIMDRLDQLGTSSTVPHMASVVDLRPDIAS